MSVDHMFVELMSAYEISVDHMSFNKNVYCQNVC